MDAEHDLPAHAEDLDAAFAEAVADTGPHDQAEPHAAADLPLRDPETASAPAAVDPPLSPVDDHHDAAVDPSLLAAVAPTVLAAVDERQLAAVEATEPAGVNERQFAAVDPPLVDYQAAAVDGRHIAFVDVTALADAEERELETVELTVFAAGHEPAPSLIDDRLIAVVDSEIPPARDISVSTVVDERQEPVVSHRVPVAIEAGQPTGEEQLAAVPKVGPSRAWIGVVAAVSLAALAGAAIVLTLLVPGTRGRAPVSVDRAVAVESHPHAAVVARESAVVGGHQRAAVAQTVPSLAAVTAWRATDEWTGGRKKSVAYELSAEHPVRLWMRQATPTLVVRCLGGTLDAFVVTGSASAIEPGRSDHTVQLTLDDGPPETQHWTDSADHDGLFAPNGAAVFSRVASAHTLRFTFAPHNAPRAEAVFAVNGAGTFATALGKHCH